jgi:hypothetical protein
MDDFKVKPWMILDDLMTVDNMPITWILDKKLLCVLSRMLSSVVSSTIRSSSLTSFGFSTCHLQIAEPQETIVTMSQ